MSFKDLTIVEIYDISKSQNLTALCWHYLKKQNISIDSELKAKFIQDYAKTLYTRAQQNYTYKAIVELFNRNLIYFLPLKGLAIKDFYDVPELRFSCDLDILVKNKDFHKACILLQKDGWITDGTMNFHDMHFYKGQIHLELHFNICEDMPNIDVVLADVWKNVEAKEQCELQMKPAFFLFHQIAHAYYHFIHGGCGIKAVLDIKILREKLEYNEESLTAYLRKTEIMEFYEDLLSLIDYWFGDKEPSRNDLEIEKFIVDGGAYGTKKNEMIMGTIDPLFEKILLPTNVMYAYYPKLEAFHVLLPLYHLWRWCRAAVHMIRRLMKITGRTDKEAALKVS